MFRRSVPDSVLPSGREPLALVVLPDGTEQITHRNHVEYRKNGQLHREDGPALDSPDGRQWWQYGMLHREDGPALEYPMGHREWLIRGVRHRVDGPAIEQGDGAALGWYLRGKPATGILRERLESAFSAEDLTAEDAVQLVGNDPWVAAVLLANQKVDLPMREQAFILLLASTLKQG